MAERGLLFQVLFHLITQSTLPLWWVFNPGNSGVVTGYQVDEYTHNWSLEHFIACSHIYPWFMDKVSTISHLPFEPGYEDNSFLDQ